MKPKYLDQDIRQRLEGGIIFYNGLPHYVTNARSGSSRPLSLVPLTDMNGEPFNVSLDDDLLDISSQKLGYVNHRNNAYYLSRIPVRRYKQSLCLNSLEIFSPSQNASVYNAGNGSGNSGLARDILFGLSAHHMFTNSYPSSKGAIKQLQSGSVNSIALSRNVAVTRNDFGVCHVWYKSQNVGYLDSKGMVKIPEDEMSFVVSNHLKEIILQL